MLCDNLEEWDGMGDGRGFRREGTYVDLWLIRVDEWQRPTQYCRAVVLNNCILFCSSQYCIIIIFDNEKNLLIKKRGTG